MKCALLFTSINIILLLSSTTSEAQETNNSQNGSVTNAEPAHAQYRLGDESTLPVKLNRTESNEGNYHYGFRFQSGWTGKQVFVSVSGITAPFHLKINGFEYGLGDGPGTPLEYNITPFLKQELNEIQLNFDKADQNTFGNSFDGGMLIIREPVHVRDLEVTSYFQSETLNTLVRIHLFIQSYLSEQNKGRILMLNLSDPEGETIFTHKNKDRLSPGIQTSHYLPARILDLFDRMGIVVLKNRENQDPRQDRSDVNQSSIVWME